MGTCVQSFLRDLIIALIQVTLFSICFTVSLVIYIGLSLHNLVYGVVGNSHPRNRSYTSNRTQFTVVMLSNPPDRLSYTDIPRKAVTRRPLNMPLENHHTYKNYSKPQQQWPLSPQIPDSTTIEPCSSAREMRSPIASAHLVEPYGDNPLTMEPLEFLVEGSLLTSQEANWQKHSVPSELEILQHSNPSEIYNIVRESFAHASTLQLSKLDREIRPAQPVVFSVFGSGDACTLTSNPWASVEYRTEEVARDRNNSTCSGTTLTSESSCTFSKCSTGSSSSSVDTNPASVSWKEVLRVDPNKVVPGTMGFPSSGFIDASTPSSSEHAKSSRSPLFRRSYLRPKMSSTSEKKLLKECASCFDDVPGAKAVSLSCQHSYCGECFTRLVSTAVANEHLFPPKCCLIDVPERTVTKNVDDTVLGAYRRAIQEYGVPAEDRWFCANTRCAKWFDASKLKKKDHNLKCPTCKTRMCRVCRGLSHKNQEDCPPNKDLEATLETVHLQGWVRCRQCHAAIEKRDGCLHITCRCKAQFW